MIESTTMSEPVGAGSLNDRQPIISEAVLRWNKAHKGVVTDFRVDAGDLSVLVDVVGRTLSSEESASLQRSVSEAEPVRG